MNKTLVIILSETREYELTFDNFKKNVIDELNADLCLCIAVKPDYNYENPFYKLAKYHFIYNEPDDFAEAFDYATNFIKQCNYKKIENINTLHGKLKNPKDQTENIKYCGICDDDNNIDISKFYEYEEIIVHHHDFYDQKWAGQIYAIYKSYKDNYKNEDKVTTYEKNIEQTQPWRKFLKIKDQFLGGIKDNEDEHPGSAGILIFFRWFLLKNLIDNNLLDKYDRFIITRSDFIYRIPHPKMELMNEDFIWIPNSEHYRGYTDRHVVLSKKYIEPYLNILNNMINDEKDYFNKLKIRRNWNLESIIKFHLEQNNVIQYVKEFPYIMYSIRSINGTTRWTKGTFYEEHGYFIKYSSEYDKSKYYSNLFENSNMIIDDFYKKYI